MNQELGIENQRLANLTFTNRTSLGRTDKNHYKNDLVIMADIDLTDPFFVEGFSLVMHNKSIVMSCGVTLGQLEQMVEFVKKNQNGKYNMAVQQIEVSN